MKQISVVIPCYNQAPYIAETLQSVIAQSYKNLEIIIINDGSTDKSPEIVKSFEAKHKNIKVFNIENGGVSKARNLGIEKASNELIFLMDGDDTINEEYIEKLYAEFENDSETIISIGKAAYFGNHAGEWTFPKFTMKKMLHGNIIFCGLMFKKQDWERAGKFDENLKYREDWDFFIRLSNLNPNKIKQVDYLGFNYRLTGNGRDTNLKDHNLLQEINLYIYNKNKDLYFSYYDDPISLIKEVETLKWHNEKKRREIEYLNNFFPVKILNKLRKLKNGKQN